MSGDGRSHKRRLLRGLNFFSARLTLHLDAGCRLHVMIIKVLYFDGCPNYQPTVALVRQVAAELGLEITIEEIPVNSPLEAVHLRFLGSPTVQINDRDIEPAARTPTEYSISCRLYAGGAGIPPRALLVAACQEASYV